MIDLSVNQFSEEIEASNEIKIRDRLMFFSADKPAAQFERGTQRGGNYPCGSCGVHVDSMDDFAYCSNLTWRSLQELQAIVVKGMFHACMKRAAVYRMAGDFHGVLIFVIFVVNLAVKKFIHP